MVAVSLDNLVGMPLSSVGGPSSSSYPRLFSTEIFGAFLLSLGGIPEQLSMRARYCRHKSDRRRWTRTRAPPGGTAAEHWCKSTSDDGRRCRHLPARRPDRRPVPNRPRGEKRCFWVRVDGGELICHCTHCRDCRLAANGGGGASDTVRKPNCFGPNRSRHAHSKLE